MVSRGKSAVEMLYLKRITQCSPGGALIVQLKVFANPPGPLPLWLSRDLGAATHAGAGMS